MPATTSASPIAQADVARVLAAYDHALAVLRDALDRGDIERRLGNQVIRPVFSVRAAS